MCDLNKESGFNDILEYYNKNKHKKWSEWLVVDDLLPRAGKQGLVGIFKTKDEKENNKKIIFKVSQHINYLVQHELTVMKALNKISIYCPHFCRGIGGILAEVDPKIRKEGNPFSHTCKYPIEKEVLLTEYIPNSTIFYNYIRSDRVSDNILFSTVKQILLAISIAQNKKKFTHYDLHSNNIMMRKCDKDLVFLYVLDEQNQYCVPTYGKYPVVIDYGFAYAETLDKDWLWPSLGHTDVGFTSDRFDRFADPKLFLVTVAGEINEKRRSRESEKLFNISKNLFSSLVIDWSSGWDKGNECSVSEHVTNMLKKYTTNSELFKDYDQYCIDLLQSLIILPLKKQDYSDIKKSFVAFLTEFVKIENEIGNPFYSLYILKIAVDSAREVRDDYSRKKSRDKAVSNFKKTIYSYVDSIAGFCNPKDVHFEKMLCGLLCLARGIEGVYYKKMKNEKEKEYSKIPLQSLEQIYASVEINIPDKYEFNEKTKIFVIDCVNEKCGEFKLKTDEIEKINETDSLGRGIELYGLYSKTE